MQRGAAAARLKVHLNSLPVTPLGIPAAEERWQLGTHPTQGLLSAAQTVLSIIILCISAREGRKILTRKIPLQLDEAKK